MQPVHAAYAHTSCKPQLMKRWRWTGKFLALVLRGCATLPGAAKDAEDGRQVEYVLAGQGLPVAAPATRVRLDLAAGWRWCGQGVQESPFL
jgi:hypothetical protein